MSDGPNTESNGQWYDRKYDENITKIKHYKTPKCKTCPALTQCTSNDKGRILERSEYAEAAERNTQRVRRQPSIYAARQQIIEHVFGTIKRQWGYDHILLKGLQKNDGEFGLIYLVYNFRRIINILGVDASACYHSSMCYSSATGDGHAHPCVTVHQPTERKRRILNNTSKTLSFCLEPQPLKIMLRRNQLLALFHRAWQSQ